MATVPYWVQAITAAAALLGPLVAYAIAHKNIETTLRVARRQTTSALDVASKQVHANVVSTNRQKWIDALRDDLAAFITESSTARARVASGRISASELYEIAKPMILLYNRLRLRLNPGEEDHREVIETVKMILQDIRASNVADLEERVAALGQTILKREWTRVKQGD